jgi:hypothetical protein
MSGAIHPLTPVFMAYKEYSYMNDVSDLRLYYQVISFCYTKADLRIRGDGRYLNTKPSEHQCSEAFADVIFLNVVGGVVSVFQQFQAVSC